MVGDGAGRLVEPLRVAADIGGTFTDIVMLLPDGTMATRKLLSTPPDYGEAVVTGIRDLMAETDFSAGSIREVVHGCTVATNAILEGKGARMALITTQGFRDVLEIRRVRTPKLYDPLYVKPEPLVPRELRLEVRERVGPDGGVITPLDEQDVERAVGTIRSSGVEAVAVAFLHSYANPEHERAVGEVLRRELPGHFISLSVDVLPEIREYERTSTAVINAYVGPPVESYIGALLRRLKENGIAGRLLIMQSSGGIVDARLAMQRPAQIVECGPAAGVVGSAFVAHLMKSSDVITFDMGGTSAKASMIEGGKVNRTDEYEVGSGISLSSRLIKGGGYALKLPVLDISEVGAGGGSVVWIDKAGLLKVGPESQGSRPGPACYCLGGDRATVTDANVVLGFVSPHGLAGGAVPIRAEKAEWAIGKQVAEPLGRNLLEAAFGVYVVACASMIRAIKAVSTYRGRDPRDFALLAFGGNGGVFAAEMARSLAMRQIIVPPAAGVFSALGLLVSDIQYEEARAFLAATDTVAPAQLNEAYASLEDRVLKQLGTSSRHVALRRTAALRYCGQAFELPVPVAAGLLDEVSIEAMVSEFETEHERTYGHRFTGNLATEMVNVAVSGTMTPPGRHYPKQRQTTGSRSMAGSKPVSRPAYFGPGVGVYDTAVIDRQDLCARPRQGPLIVEEYEGTTVVPPRGNARLDEWANIIIDIDNPV